MTSLLFHDLPPGPVPLFIGEPGDKVPEAGTLLLDHVGREVRWLASDPFQAFSVPAHSVQRYTFWEIDPMLPRWQLHDLYGETRPLLDRIQMGTAMTRLPTHWDRTQTPEAQAAHEMVCDLTAQPAQTAIDWVPGLRTVRRETALERAIRLEGGVSFEAARAQFLTGMAEIEQSGVSISPDKQSLRNALTHMKLRQQPVVAEDRGSGKTVTLEHFKDLAPSLGVTKFTEYFYRHLTVPRGLSVKDAAERAARSIKADMANPRKVRKGINGKWGKLFDESDTRRMTG